MYEWKYMNQFRYAMLALIAVGSVVVFTGCVSSTKYGQCVGISDDKDPALQYKLSVRNAVIGVFLAETIIVPVVVLVNEIQCPVGVKK
jgi:hypothetical protein